MKPFRKNLSELAQSLFGLGLLYAFIGGIINHAYKAFTGDINTTLVPMSAEIKFDFCKEQVLEWGDVMGTICGVFVVCTITVFLIWLILEWICNREWVQEDVEIEECWEEITWYNPWTWVKSIVCTTKEVLKWILKLICKVRKVLIWIIFIVCIVAGLVALA